MNVLAYHITWGTYGTRLHGDPRGTVDRKNNERGTPVLRYDEHRWEQEKSTMKFPPIYFNNDQMAFVESIVPSVCDRGFWKLQTCAAGPDHVHVLLTSEHDPETIRRLLKRWIGQELSTRYSIPKRASWWAECGSIRWIDSERYLITAKSYVNRQRATEAPSETKMSQAVPVEQPAEQPPLLPNPANRYHAVR